MFQTFLFGKMNEIVFETFLAFVRCIDKKTIGNQKSRNIDTIGILFAYLIIRIEIFAFLAFKTFLAHE